LGFGFVFALSQAAAGMLLRSASPKHQNSSLPNGYSISSNALIVLIILLHDLLVYGTKLKNRLNNPAIADWW
jgi:hypothetical protein